jgi:hypothetical protein
MHQRHRLCTAQPTAQLLMLYYMYQDSRKHSEGLPGIHSLIERQDICLWLLNNDVVLVLDAAISSLSLKLGSAVCT